MKKNNDAAKIAWYISEFMETYAPSFLTNSEHTLKSYRDTITLYVAFSKKKASRHLHLPRNVSRRIS